MVQDAVLASGGVGGFSQMCGQGYSDKKRGIRWVLVVYVAFLVLMEMAWPMMEQEATARSMALDMVAKKEGLLLLCWVGMGRVGVALPGVQSSDLVSDGVGGFFQGCVSGYGNQT